MTTHRDGKMVVTPAPHHEESIFGYVLRLAVANGYQTPLPILRTLNPGRTYLHLDLGPEVLERLAELTGHSADQFAELPWAKWPDGAPIEKTQHSASVFSRLVGPKKTKLCPDCVAESGITKYIWDVRAIVACPTHRKALVRACQKCGKRVNWLRLGMGRCRCGHKFEAGAPVSTELAELMSLVQAHVAGKPSEHSAVGFPVAEIRDCTTVEVLRLLVQIGKAVDPAFDSEFPTIESSEKIARFLARWPEGLFKHIDETLVDEERDSITTKEILKGHTRLKNIFATTNLATDRLKWISEAIEAYVQRYWNGHYQTKLALEADLAQVKRVVRDCGVHPRTAQRWLRQGYRGAVPRRFGRIKTSIDFPHPNTLRSEFVKESEAAGYIGIPSETFRSMASQGMFELVVSDTKKPLLRANEVIALRERFMQMAGKNLEKLPSGCTTIDQVCRRKYDFPRDMRAALLKAIHDGTLVPEGIMGDQVRDIVIKRKSIERLDRCRTFGNREYPTFDEVAKELGVEYRLVPSMIQLGYLASAAKEHGTRRVTRDSLNAFKTEWKTVNFLAEQCGLTAAHRFRRAIEGSGYPLLVIHRGSNEYARQYFIRNAHAAEVYRARDTWLPALRNTHISADLVMVNLAKS